MTSNNIYEISKRSILISKYHVAGVTFNDSMVTTTSDKGIHFVDFSYNLKSLDKAIDAVESIILTSKNSPAAHLFPKEVMCKQIPSLNFNEMLLDQAFWPHNSVLTQNSVVIAAAEWSPKDFIYNNLCVLAVLNNIGCVEIYTQQMFRWINIFNLSNVIEDLLKDQLPKLQDLNQIKIAVKMVETSAICWCPKLNSDNSCYFVTCQKDGSMLFWSLKSIGIELKANFCGKTDSELGEAVSVRWICSNEDKFMLIYSNIFGQVFGKICLVENNQIKVTNTNSIWTQEDRMCLSHLNYEIYEDKIVLIYSKYRHLVVQVIDWELNVVAQYTENVNDNKISFICNDDNSLVLSTINFKIYEIVWKITDTLLNVSLEPVVTKDLYKTYELHGAKFSKNKVVLTAIMLDRKVFCRKENFKIDIVFLCNNTDIDAVAQILVNNTTKKLTNYWDCIEFLRYRCLKQRKLPTLDYSQLYSVSSDTYNLKLYHIILVIHHLLQNRLNNETKGVLPETSLTVVRERIFLHEAISIINGHEGRDNFTCLESDCLDGAEKFIKYYCNKYEKDIHNFLPSNRINQKRERKDYTCQCCDETIVSFTCKNEHLNMFCSLTFTPIETDDYLVCKGCGLLGRIELFSTKPECLLCDLPLNNCYLPT